MNPNNLGVLTLAYKNFTYMASMRHDFVINAVDKQTDADYKPTDLGVEVVRINNKNFAANWNEGVRLFRERHPEATHVLLQNSDISYNPEALAYAIFRLSPNVHLATWAFNSAWGFCQPNSKVNISGGVPFVEFTAPIISLELWDKVGGIDERAPHWGNDIKFGYDAWALGYKPEVFKDFTFNHYGKKSTPNYNAAKFSSDCQNYLTSVIGKDWKQKVQQNTPLIKIW